MKQNGDGENLAFWHNFFSGIYLFLVVVAIYYLESSQKLAKEVSVFEFFLLALATFRLIRLLVYDSVTQHIRDYLERQTSGIGRELALLINCPWCTGVWAGLFVGFLFFVSPLATFFILILALAGLGSFMQTVAWKIGLDPRKEKEE